MEILRDSLWQFVGAFLAFVAISISIIFYLAQRQKKKLNYETFKLPLLSFEEEFEGKLKIFYEDHLVNNVISVLVSFYNTGNQSITSNDFEKKISLVFDEKTKILSCSVHRAKPNNLDIKLELDQHKLSIAPLLLNPKDSFAIRAIITGEEKKFHLDYRIIGISKIVEQSDSKYEGRFLLKTYLGMILLAAVVGLVSTVMSPMETKGVNLPIGPFSPVVLLPITITFALTTFYFVVIEFGRWYTRRVEQFKSL